MVKVLLTGASGFVGNAYIEFLSKKPLELYSLGRTRVINVAHCALTDLQDRNEIVSIISRIRPDIVLHLAGNPYTSSTLESKIVNYEFSTYIFAAIEAAGLKDTARLLFFGSAAEYGAPANLGEPIVEEQLCRPKTNYGANKLKQTQYVRKRIDDGYKAIVVRPFTIIGANMPKRMAVQQFISEARQISLSGETTKSINLQNPNTFRDFIGVENVVELSWELINLDIALGKTFNICSGVPVSFENLVNYLAEKFQIKSYSKPQATDVDSAVTDFHYGSNAKLLDMLGPRHIDDWKTTIDRML